MNHWSLTEIEVLARLAGGDTLRHMASDMGLQEPAVSRALHAAEVKAGFGLVEHRGRRVFLTSVGQDLARGARRVVDELDKFEELLQEVNTSQRGTLRVLVTRGPADYVLPGILASFLKRHPQVDVDVDLALHRELWKVLVEQGYDVGIGPMPNFPLDAPIDGLYFDRLLFFAPYDSELVTRRTYRWSELRDISLVVGPFDEEKWQIAVDTLSEHGTAPLKERHLRSPEAVKNMVEAEAGLGVLFSSAIWRDLASGRFFKVPVEGFDVSVPYGLIRRAAQRPAPIVNTFCEFLLREIAPLREAMARA